MSGKRKGGGPRSAAGKAIACRNALRHGFATNLERRPPAPERIERLAHAIAGADSDPAVVAAAFKIAENELLLGEIAAHKVWVVERLREPYASPFASKDNSLQLETARAMQMWLAGREIDARLPAIIEKYKVQTVAERDGIVPFRLMAMLKEPDECESTAAKKTVSHDSEDRDEYEALEAAIGDLTRLNRYERRAWSRQRRAILQLANLKLGRRFA